jgi:hypothetical protein
MGRALGFLPGLTTPTPSGRLRPRLVDGMGVYLRSIQPEIITVNDACPGKSTVEFIHGGCPWTAQGSPGLLIGILHAHSPALTSTAGFHQWPAQSCDVVIWFEEQHL